MPVRALAGRTTRSGRRPLPVVNKLKGHSTPPPVGGWNARDSLANMEEDEAIELINWFPEESRVRIRKGHESHATGLGGPVESLMAWHGPSSSKLFGAATASIFECTSAGAVGSADITGLTNARWQHTMFSASSGNYLYAVNGADPARRYNGTAWAVPVLSGVSSSSLIHVNVFKNRLFFIEKDSLSAWYLDIDSVSGTLTEFDLGPNADLGGYLVAMATWTRDGGDGVDDYAVFLTSKGQAIIFQGSDPSVSNDWFKVGTFNIGAPIGRRCMIKVGADIIVVTEDGFSQLSRFLAAARSSDRAAQSDMISGAVNDAVINYRSLFGWQPVFYPLGDKMLFNIPMANGEYHQFVSHTATGKWCKFTGWDARCFVVFNNELYFGGSGAVYKADTGTDDDGSAISTEVKTAYSYFGNRGLVKRFAMIRPNLFIEGSVTATLHIETDFAEEPTAESVPTFTEADGTAWDEGAWDEFEWGDTGATNRNWQTVEGVGTCARLHMEIDAENGEVFWNASDWLYEPVASPGFLTG